MCLAETFACHMFGFHLTTKKKKKNVPKPVKADGKEIICHFRKGQITILPGICFKSLVWEERKKTLFGNEDIGSYTVKAGTTNVLLEKHCDIIPQVLDTIETLWVGKCSLYEWLKCFLPKKHNLP